MQSILALIDDFKENSRLHEKLFDTYAIITDELLTTSMAHLSHF